MDTALLLEKPKGYTPDQGCRFLVVPTKDRTLLLNGKTYLMDLTTSPNGLVGFSTMKDKEGQAEDILVAKDMLRDNPDLSMAEALELGLSRTAYFRARKELEAAEEI